MRTIRPRPPIVRPNTPLILVIRQQAGINQAIDNRLTGELQVRHLAPPVIRKPIPNLDMSPFKTRDPGIPALDSRQSSPPLRFLVPRLMMQPLIGIQMLRLPLRFRHRNAKLPHQTPHDFSHVPPLRVEEPRAPRLARSPAAPPKPPAETTGQRRPEHSCVKHPP